MLHALLMRPRERGRMFVALLSGPTGIGKTQGSRTFLEGLVGTDGYFIWSPKHDKGWWDGYDGQDWVFIDDIDTKTIALAEMLRLLQDLPFKAPVHGGQVDIRAHNFIISTNKTVKQLYPFAEQAQIAAFDRRVCATLEPDDIEVLHAMPHGTGRVDWMASWLRDAYAANLA